MRLLLGVFFAFLMCDSTARNCIAGEPENLVPLRRFYNYRTHEHQYATDNEKAAEWRKLKYFNEQVIVGLVSPVPVEGTIRLFHGTMAKGRHIYYVGQRPKSVLVVDESFKAYVWRNAGDARVGVYCSTWLDGGDVYFDDQIQYVDQYSANTLKNLKVKRLRPQATATYFVYPSPRRQSTLKEEAARMPELAAKDDVKPAGRSDAIELSNHPPSSVSRSQTTAEMPDDDGVVRFTELMLENPATSLEMTEDGRQVLFTHQMANRVSVYDVLSGKVTQVIETSAPRSVICRSGKAYVANFGKGTISVFDRSQQWRLVKVLKTLKPNIVHISAARGNRFNNELLITCHGPGPKASYRDSHTMLVDVRRNFCSNLGSDAVANVSADGTLVYTQKSFNLSPSGGISGWEYSRYTVPGTPREPLTRGGVMQTPYVYQLVPGSFLISHGAVFGGTQIQEMPGDFGDLIVPDHSQKILYTLTADVLRAHALNAALPQLELRSVKYPSGYKDLSKIVFPIQRMRGYLLDHPVAYTHGNRLHLFVLTSTAGRVLAAEVPAVKPVDIPKPSVTEQDDAPSLAASKPKAEMNQPQTNSDSMEPSMANNESMPADPGKRMNLADVIAKCELSVVRIETTGAIGGGTGSGFVVDSRGTIVTNCHVIEGASEAQVHFADGGVADVLGTLVIDEARDIAIIKISDVDRPAFTFSKALPRKGEEIVALGAPLGLAFTATRGIVSAIRSGQELATETGQEREGTWIQVDAALSPGNSGGPLINEQGNVVAMATLASTGVAQSLNFGISAADIRESIEGARTRSLVPLAEGAANLTTPGQSGPPRNDGQNENSVVPKSAIAEYLNNCKDQYAKLVRELRKESGRLNSMLREMRRGATVIPNNVPVDGNIVKQRTSRGTTWFFGDERTKDRAIEFVQERVGEVNDLTSSLKGSDDPKSILNLANNYGPLLDGRDVGKVGFLSEAIVFSAINHTDVLITYDGAVYLISLETTAGIGPGEFLKAQPAYVVGTATAQSPRGSVVVTVLQAVAKSQLADAPPAKPTRFEPNTTQGEHKDPREVSEPVRTWRDKSGRHAVKATFIDFDSKAVRLRKEDGTTIAVSPDSLCQEDIDYLKQKWQEKKLATAE